MVGDSRRETVVVKKSVRESERGDPEVWGIHPGKSRVYRRVTPWDGGSETLGGKAALGRGSPNG